MTPLENTLGSGELVAWRLDQNEYRETWDSGEGSYKFGGRWSVSGVRAVYCSIDPATAILEVAVHKGFAVLDTKPFVLTAITIDKPGDVFIVNPDDVPNPNWLRPSYPSQGQQRFGSDLLERHKFVAVPSAVSTHSWNLIFVGSVASGAYRVRHQERFALDPRLHPPP